jgi:glycosyltransferase involved in cell wall biosynthesis
MMSGLCVVTTEQPQCRELFEQLGQTDLLMPPDDPVKLADALESLAKDRQRVKTQGRKSRELAIGKYTWRRAVTDTFAEVQKLMNGSVR